MLHAEVSGTISSLIRLDLLSFIHPMCKAPRPDPLSGSATRFELHIGFANDRQKLATCEVILEMLHAPLVHKTTELTGVFLNQS